MTGEFFRKECRLARKAIRVRGIVLVAAPLFLWPLSAMAQRVPAVPTLPGAVQPGRDRPLPAAPSQPDFDLSIESPERSPVGRAVDELHFTLKDIHISGTHALSEASFRPLFEKLIGKDVKLADILNVADQIEQTYRNYGYILVRAYVPPQRVSDGVFTINVVEGKLNAVTVQGGTPATQAQIKAYMRPSLDVSPLPLATMERSLLLSNDLPGMAASGVLRPAEGVPGASDVVVTVEQPRVTGGLGFDNRGSRFSGLWTLNGDVEVNSIFGADQLGALLTTSPDASEQIAGQLRYRTPIGGDGLIGSLVGTVTHGEPGSTLAAFGVNTDSWAVGPRLTYPLIRTRAQSLQLDGGLTAQEADIDILGSHVSHDQWRVADIAVTYLRSNFLGGSWLATLGVAQGLPGLGATANGSALLSRKGGYTDFTKLNGVMNYLAPVGHGFSVALTGQGQFAFVPLINGELISFGGLQVGRGYDPGAITGDHGLGGTAELRYDVPFANTYVTGLQPYIYTDGAESWYIQRGAAVDTALKNQDISSVGGGVRVNLPHSANLGFEVSRTLDAVLGSDAGKQATKFFINGGVRF
jgi:hemolysin activation/secretion protein